MAIQDKNGKIYKLQGPNPIMQTQELWDNKQITLININCQEHTASDPKRNRTIEKLCPQKPPVQTHVVEPPIETTQLLVEPPTSEQELITPAPVNDSLSYTNEQSQPPIYTREDIKKKIDFFHCLPIETKTIKDALSGQSMTINTYGKKFSFEGIIVEEEDLYLIFWTTKELALYSVVYPKNYSKRWWKIQNLESDKGGWTITGVPSLDNPDFTD